MNNTNDKQTYGHTINELFGTIAGVMQFYQNDSKRARRNLELGVLIAAEIKKSKNATNTTLSSGKKTEKTLAEKISEAEPREKDELTTLPGRFSNTQPFNYQLPEKETAVDYSKFFSYKPEQKITYEEEIQEKDGIHGELQTVRPEVIRRMTVQKLAERAPEYSFLKKYVSPEDKERYEAFRRLNRAQTDNMELILLHTGMILN